MENGKRELYSTIPSDQMNAGIIILLFLGKVNYLLCSDVLHVRVCLLYIQEVPFNNFRGFDLLA
jgi:hypothetical protein